MLEGRHLPNESVNPRRDPIKIDEMKLIRSQRVLGYTINHMALITQSRPDYGLGVQDQAAKPFEVFPFRSGFGGGTLSHRTYHSDGFSKVDSPTNPSTQFYNKE